MRCFLNETTEHLLWECFESQKIWKSYNEVLKAARLEKMNINKYEDIYRTEVMPILSIVKKN